MSNVPRKHESISTAMFFNVTAPIAERFLAAAAACENALVDNTNYKNGSISSVLFQHYQTVKHHLPYEFVDLQEPSVYALFANQTPLQKLEYLFQTYLNQTAALSRADAANLLRAIFTGLATVCAASSMTANNSSAVLLEQNANTKSLPPTKRYKYDTDTNTNCNETATTAASSLSEESTNGDSGEVSQQLEKLVASSVDSLCKFCHDTIVLASFLEWTKGLEWINLLDREHWNYMARSFSSTTTHASVKAPPLPTPASTSNTVISFDFTGAQGPQCCIDISKDNLHALKHLCYCTGLVHCSAAQLCKVLVHMGQSTGDARNIHRNAFQAAMATGLLPPQFANLSRADQDTFTSDMMHIFFLLEHNETPGQANASELAIAMCFYCAGTKSSKLATGFELLDDTRVGYLTEDQLLVYLQSYLMSLVALSFLATNKHHQRNPITLERRTELRAAVETGARWTLSHYFDYVGTSDPSFRKNRFTFESFASWYSLGGYNVAPWLELLDLNKVLSLIAEAPQPPPSPLPYVPPTTRPRDRMSSLRRHYSNRRSLPPDVLFSFPLASRRSLVVLKEDAVYVRDVVDQLHLLTLNPNELWESLSKAVVKRRKPKKDEVAVYVSCTIFTQSMLDICRKHSDDMAELLSNFFYCFDIDQVDSVALDELMGGLTLLCGGKKSMKLSFAFSIFDTRPGMSKKKDVAHTLSGEDLFLFLRSILIVTFSCCRQSLDMSDEVVSRCISDTANMICNDVMRHQWETKQTDRLNFDDFGQWYNDGGFERAPWLELLDLRKWVLVEDYEQLPKQAPGGPIGAGIRSPPKPAVAPKLLRAPPHPTQTDVPPPPPEDSLDASFFDDAGIMPMDSMDEMDMMLMHQSSDKDDFERSFSFSPRQQLRPESSFHASLTPNAPPLKFHLVTSDSKRGYNLSYSRVRIDHFRQLLWESGLADVSVEDACNAILDKAVKPKGKGTKSDYRISKEGFNTAVQSFIQWKANVAAEKRLALQTFLDFVFDAFDRNNSGKPSVMEVACGFTVLCKGHKSEKLEFSFEVLDKEKGGALSKEVTSKYLQSFLTVLLSIAFAPSLNSDQTDACSTFSGEQVERKSATICKAVKAGAEWATALAFRGLESNSQSFPVLMTFDHFAAWYTSEGHESIPWIELIDLGKWVVAD